RFGIAMLILHQPVRWDNDGGAVDTVMMIAGPTDQVSDHLRILANSSQLLDSKAVRTKLRSAPSAREAYALLSAAEAAVEQRRNHDGMLRDIRTDETPPSDYLSQVASQFNW